MQRRPHQAVQLLRGGVGGVGRRMVRLVRLHRRVDAARAAADQASALLGPGREGCCPGVKALTGH